jgi:hypothetical protein
MSRLRRELPEDGCVVQSGATTSAAPDIPDQMKAILTRSDG